MKKILFVNSSPHYSGAEISLENLVGKLSDEDFELYVMMPIENRLYRQLNTSRIHILPGSFRFLTKPKGLFSALEMILSVVRVSWEMMKIMRSFQISVLYCNSLKSACYAFIPLWFCRTYAILHLRDCIQKSLLSFFLLRHFRLIVCPSCFIKSQIEGARVQTMVIPNGVELGVQSDRETKRGAPFIIAIIGQITSWKRIEDFIGVAVHILNTRQDVEFKIIGQALTNDDLLYRDRIMRLIKQNQLGNKVLFAGFVDIMSHAYKGIDVVVHCALYEPFGRVIVESLAMGVPVVAYNSGGPGEILCGFPDLLADSADTKELAEKVCALLDDEKLRMQVASQGKAYVHDKYSISHSVSVLSNHLLNLG